MSRTDKVPEQDAVQPALEVRRPMPIHASGPMADLVRNHDWTTSAVGGFEQWSLAQLAVANLALGCLFPAIALLGPDFAVLYNDAYIPIIADRHPRALGLSGRLVWPEAWEFTRPQWQAVMAQGKSFYMENVLVPVVRDGALQDVYWTYSYSPIFEPDGTSSGVLIICHDVTEELLARRQRDALAEQLERAMEVTTDAVLSMDRNWTVTYMNPQAIRTAMPIGDATGRNFWEAFPATIFPNSPYEAVYHAAMNAGEPGELEAFYPEPLNIWTHVQARPSRDGIVLFFRDVTEERRRNEERAKLLEDRQQFFTLCQSSTDFIAIANMEGKPFYANPAACRMLGIDGLEAFGGEDMRAMFFPEDRAMMMNEFLPRVLREESQSIEIRFRNFVTGEAIISDFRAFLLRDAHGTPIGYATVSHDLRQQKQTAEALIKTEKLAAVGRLAASIAHEINNPLESVTNLLYLARESGNTTEIKEYLTVAERELRRVSVIANQTLRFHKQASRPRPVTCEDLVASVVSIYQGRLVNCGVLVEERTPCNEKITCFDGEIRQVLSNLVGNAIDALLPGGKLLLRSRSATEWKSARRGAVITVADTGTGIEAEVLKRMFEPFFTTKGFGGTGLGLWVSSEIVARHQGVLTMRSRVGTGTVFRLFLPFEAALRD